MKFTLCNDKDTGSLVYKEGDVFTTKGQSGAPILAEKEDKTVYLVGVHDGTHEGQSFGSLDSNNGKCDNMINFIESNVEELNETAEARGVYMKEVSEFKEEHKDYIDERQFEREGTELKRSNQMLVQQQQKFEQSKIKKLLKDTKIEHNISISDEPTKGELIALKQDIENADENLHKVLELFDSDLSFDKFQNHEDYPYSFIQDLLDFKDQYYKLPKLNVVTMLGNGKIKLARNLHLANSILPFNTNITYA